MRTYVPDLRPLYWWEEVMMMVRYGAEPTKKQHKPRKNEYGQTIWRDTRDHDEKANAICDFVTSFFSDNGYSPSYREIAKGAHILSINTVEIIADELVRDGRLERTKAPTRNLIPGELR